MELIRSVRAGDVVAFEELAKMYQPLIMAQVSHFISSGTSVIPDGYRDDLYQEALLALYKAACSFVDKDNISFGAYAKVCVRNGLLTVTKKLLRLYYADSEYKDALFVFEDTEDSGTSPEETVIAEERAMEIHSFIEEQLTEYERRVFSLHLSHHTYAEIAEITGRDVKSVANAILRVREKFRKRGF